MSAQSKTLPASPSVAAGKAPARLAVIGAFLATYLIWGSTYLAIWYAVARTLPLNAQRAA